MSLARRTQDRILAMKKASAPASGSGLTRSSPRPAAIAPGVDPAVGQIMLRLQHDLRRLKETKSIDRKIAAKREMLPEYRAWCDGELEAGRCTNGRNLGPSAAPEILPTVMVWSIDIGDWPRALELAEHVLRFNVPLPSRYERDAATLVLEEIAEAALKVQARAERFPYDVLERVAELTVDIDMHDQPRAKLAKAIGTELTHDAGEIEAGTPEHRLALAAAHGVLQRAQQLHDRIGVKTQIRALEKAIAAQPAPEQAGTAPAA